MSAFDWSGLLWETRGFLDLDEDDAVPVDELVAQAEANGHTEREARDAIADADELEAVGDLDDLRVRLADTAVSEENATENAEERQEPTTTPTPEAEETAPRADEDAVDALRDVLRFYHNRVDDEIADHTDDGEHPERPTTAREYFTERRGWDSDTVDDLLLGWAPPDHADRLVAWLHDRGHSREAILATGAVGVSDTGGFYATLSARYVLPYYDADGEAAYAIARCTGGDGGGARGYGGHPEDYKAGKYAKLRHTDERVPFDEPIYGLDTLEGADHVVVAEGIADAITAREAGYAVLSPVAKQFKEAHYDPLVGALEAHGVERVTIVADADNIQNEPDEDAEPETIREAVGVSMDETPAGLGGALRTAAGIGTRADVDVRVTLPPAPADLENDLDDFVTGPWDGDLAALLRSARPPEAFGEFVEATADQQPAAAFDDFDAKDYEPSATSADDTTTEIRDVYAAIDRLDARRVAEDTIVSEWLDDRGDKRHFAPVWAPANYDGTANFVDRDKWVDTGGRGGRGGPAVMAAIDAGLVRDTECPRAVRGGTWREAVDHLRDLGYAIPELEDRNDSGDAFDETDRDLLDVDVVVEPAKALAAAAAVEPDDLDTPLPELEREDVDDVAIAVALAEGRISSPDEFPDDGGYTEAYYRARDHYGAPLPKYLDNTTLEHREDLVFAALERIGAPHILGATRSDITVEDPDGVAFAKLNPTWEDSDSGERILAGYGRGFYCVEHDVTFSPIQLVALEHELIDSETEYPRGEAFKQAYRLLREEYGAPVPKWRATILEHVAVLPPAVRLLGDSSTGPSLEDARKKTEALVRDAVDVRDRAQLITNLPATGKTYSTAAVADETPILYLAGRNELKQQMEDYCREVREDDEDHPDAEPTARHLPIFAENQLPDDVILDAVRAVEEDGRGLLQDREALLDRVDVPDEWDEDDEDAVDVDRESCPTADGEHGLGWALAVQTARALAQTPQEIHTHATVLFGEELPCQHDGDCPYTRGWEAVREPPCADVLIGSPGHAYVGSATTYFEPDGDGGTEETPRAVVVDEFPDDEYVTEYGDRYLDHATWLADALVGVGTREDLTRAELETDTWVNHWLDGEGGELAGVAEAIDALNAGAALCDARDEAADLLDSGRLEGVSATSARLPAVSDALEDLAHGAPTDADLDAIAERLASAEATVRADADQGYATDDPNAGALYRLADRLDSVLTSLSVAVEGDEDLLTKVERATEALDVGGDLRRLLDDALAALQGEDRPEGLLDVAVTALQGGREGCRELAIFAEDGYAHPDAWALLAGAIADDVREVDTDTFAFDGDEGGRFKHLTKDDATVVADKDQHGALVADHPAFTDITGAKCPVLGLDATGRTGLWRLALGRDTQRRDIHDSDAQRRGFLREAMNLTVVQTTNDPLPYHGSPDGKNFAEDLELVKTVAEEYTGVGADTLDDEAPAVISTLKVLTHLEDDLGDLASGTVNYENMKGSDALGERQVSIILGSCHFGDAAPEKWGLLAGEDSGRGDTRGDTLDYGSDVANTYLKHMREDYTMQAILRAGRNDEASVVFAHTSALRGDLPVDEEAAVLSAHSRGTLAVAEAAKDLRGEPFTATDVVEVIDGDDRAVGRRQVQNVLADLREGGYLRVVEEGGPGVGYEYELDEDPGLADAELPEPRAPADSDTHEPSENPANRGLHTWDFRSRDSEAGGNGVTPPTRPTIPAAEAADELAPPG